VMISVLVATEGIPGRPKSPFLQKLTALSLLTFIFFIGGIPINRACTTMYKNIINCNMHTIGYYN